MTDVHPTLEVVARAICAQQTGHLIGEWQQFLPEARAALNALIDNAQAGRGDGSVYVFLDWLREIAAEPKPPTVEDVLMSHQRIPLLGGGMGQRCSGCDSLYGEADGRNSPRHAAHVADMLREAGLLKEDAEADRAAGWLFNPDDRVCYTDECAEPCQSFTSALADEEFRLRKENGRLGNIVGELRAKVARVEEALARHPGACDKYPDPDDTPSCGWKRAVADVTAALADEGGDDD